jgi:hypothetical protein
MKKLVNLYIVLFMLDGIFSLLDVVVERLTGVQAFGAMRGLMGIGPFMLAFPLYCIMGCMGGFPKRTVLPMVLFVAWSTLFFGLPLPIYLGTKTTELLLSIAQPALGLWVLFEIRRSGRNEGWLHGPGAFEGIQFSGKRTCGFLAANVFGVVPLLALYLGLSASIGVAHRTKGFVHLGPRGVSVEARTYRCNDKSIYLLPSVHIAEGSFYSDLMEELPTGKTVILPEGVTDTENLLSSGMGYDKLAPALGLVAQDGQTFSANPEIATTACDIDVSALSPEVVAFLNAMGKFFRKMDTQDRRAALLEYVSAPVPDEKLLWKEIVEDRNARVVACIHDSMETYDYIAVPWGAAHMPGIEKELLDAGAKQVDRRRVWVMRWPPKGK